MPRGVIMTPLGTALFGSEKHPSILPSSMHPLYTLPTGSYPSRSSPKKGTGGWGEKAKAAEERRLSEPAAPAQRTAMSAPDKATGAWCKSKRDAS